MKSYLTFTIALGLTMAAISQPRFLGKPIAGIVRGNGGIVDDISQTVTEQGIGLASISNFLKVVNKAIACDVTGLMPTALVEFGKEDKIIGAFFTLSSAFVGFIFCLVKSIAINFFTVIIPRIVGITEGNA